ncbi:hypothetical protein BFJ69_g861 [Fusarium oxysporum]|uniref:Uncharacterized protein n=1 Tax=Fusarium oxysporum TaxID=5507 RepID=A0A420P2H8_FUSOX|nr:hypothetical protein BFJ69_g861 [Fusarium oxysporum]
MEYTDNNDVEQLETLESQVRSLAEVLVQSGDAIEDEEEYFDIEQPTEQTMQSPEQSATASEEEHIRDVLAFLGVDSIHTSKSS